MQESDPDVLDQTESFCVMMFLLHVGMNVPTKLQLDAIRMTRGSMEVRT